MKNNTPLNTIEGRVFVRLPGGEFEYVGDAKIEGVTKPFGESAPIYGQDPSHSGKFRIIDRLPNTEENLWTFTASTYVLRNKESLFKRAAISRCTIDIQIHYGRCSDPSDFSDYESAFIIEEALISQYGTSPLVAREPKDAAVIEETFNISASNAYRFIGRDVGLSGLATIRGYITDLALCNVTCSAECLLNGCGRLYGIEAVFNGDVSPTVTLRVAWSDDNGISFNTVAVDIFNDIASIGYLIYSDLKIECTKDYLIIFNEVSENSVSPTDRYLYMALPHTSFVPTATSIFPTMIPYTYYLKTISTCKVGGAILVGSKEGRIQKLTNNLVFTTIYPAVGTPEEIVTAIDAIDLDNIISFSYQGTPLSNVRINGRPFVRTALTFIDGEVSACAMLSETHWIISAEEGGIWVTTDGGVTWVNTQNVQGCVTAISMSTPSVGYLTLSSPGLVYKTIDGGDSWTIVDKGASWPTDEGAGSFISLQTVVVCDDPNIYFVCGGKGQGGDLACGQATPEVDNIVSLTILGYGEE